MAETTRGPAVQSTEKKTITSLTIRGIERDLERTPSGRGGVISHSPATKGIGPSGTPGDNLLADWRELEAALVAERDRADRAEARLAEAWEEGYDESSSSWSHGWPAAPNPYRSEATA